MQGFIAQLSYYPDDKITVAIHSNVNSAAPFKLARILAAVTRGDKVLLPSERKEISVPDTILSQ